jgi:sugar phosphate isomerase/epimerase
MELGLSSYTYGWAIGVPGQPPLRPLDERGLLERAGVFGLKLLQLGDNLPLHTFEDTRLERLAQGASREGVQLEIGARRLTPEHVARYAAIARRLGAKLLRFVIDEVEYEPAPKRVAEILREVVPLLHGVTLGLENHDRFPAKTLRALVESAGSDRIGICLDTVNSLGAGEGIDAVCEILAPLTVNLHIKDFVIERVPHQMGFAVRGCPAGAGALDIPSLLARLARFGRCRTAVLELWTPPEAQLEDTIAKEAEWARESIEYLKPMFGGGTAG